MSFRFTENRPQLKAGEVLWLESRVREVVGKDWKPKSFEKGERDGQKVQPRDEET